MTIIEHITYETIAKELLEKIGSSCFFNGSVEVRQQESTVKLICTLIIYREVVKYPEGDVDTISDIVPVWWECRTVGEYGQNDNCYSWREFSKIVKALI